MTSENTEVAQRRSRKFSGKHAKPQPILLAVALCLCGDAYCIWTIAIIGL